MKNNQNIQKFINDVGYVMEMLIMNATTKKMNICLNVYILERELNKSIQIKQNIEI